MADMICHKVYELLMSILKTFNILSQCQWQCQWAQVESYTSTFQMQVVKSTIVFIPVACDLFILYIVCYTILAGLQYETYGKRKRAYRVVGYLLALKIP
jgi:flagellar biosynthesis protein FlhB